jgi:HTH-type transcriptional regulator/antitoxin HipB
MIMTDTIRTTGQLGHILRRLRKARGLSQVELGRKIGLSQERISVIENHPERISIDQLLTVLMALETELRIEPRNPLSAPAPATGSRTGNPATKPDESW